MTGSQLFFYTPPEFAANKAIIVPKKHLGARHI